MANNINREGFKRFLELGVPSFEGNIILDSGELSEYYYRFMRIPLAYGEHKVDVLYGQRFYGTLENKPVTFNQEIRFLCLVIDNAKTVNETQDFKTIFCRSSFTSDSVIEEMAQKLFDMFRENVTEEDKKKILKGGYYDQTARQNAFCRIIKGYKNYRSPIDSIVDEIGKGSCFGLTSTNADELVVDYLANPTGWAERTGVCIMNKTVPTIEMNPIDDIQHLLEESGCYESEVEMMKTAGTYDAFVRKVHDAIDWGYLCTQMTELENNTIAAAIEKVHGMTTKTEDDA